MNEPDKGKFEISLALEAGFREEFLAFHDFDFRATHRGHLRTMNPIESAFLPSTCKRRRLGAV